MTAWLVLMVIANSGAAVTYFLNPYRITQRFPDLSHGVVALLGFAAATNVVLAILVWNWRRVGLWGLIVLALLAFPVNLYAGLGLLRASIGLLGPVIVATLMRPKWQLFK